MMKAAVSLTLIVSVAGTTVPVTAQERLNATSAGQQSVPADPNWSRLRKLAPGTELIVTVKGSLPSNRYAVAWDASALTVLNLAAPTLPAAARDVLRDVASTHPEYFSAAQKGQLFVLERNVSVGPGGVFVDGRKIADLQQVIETSARQEVAEIKTRQKGRGVWGHLGPVGGYLVGAIGAGYAAGFACQARPGPNHCDTGAFLTGMLVGGIVGGGYGFRAANRETEHSIYRAP
jgi:hypothetical protein